MYRNNLYQCSANNHTSTEIVQLATNFIFKKESNNSLLLIGWDNSQYNDIIKKAKSDCNREKEAISYIFSGIKRYTVVEHCEYSKKTYNTLYAVEELNHNHLIPIVVKYDNESILNSSKKLLTDKELAIVYNDLIDRPSELDTFTNDNRIAYYEDNIHIYTPNQFKDCIGDILSCASE
ncbi:hypothetical protein OTSGILL_1309 [Orientia tsutsugamushi str. Gilliam]|uniref:Uncharacterized protein n=1 Tax=Orientia tsutsugamushi str. Gilliam TaxID=1359184 RepID=A0A0F3MAD0_ORITS|nr:hypothetical protein [Orientia tsutsugamushi]KJV52718.1 hypothetical protein OTSGILL_1309 [Orientia tsutsugamushi str. Gilliam]SPR12647.1 Uncharacterised protein [Orientia tsutsugamushi str. Gilliam]